MHISNDDLEEIWHEVPVDYYQNGTRKNILQKYWHTNKLETIVSMIDTTPKKILDVGCASGWFLHNVSQQFPDTGCYGIDPYADAIAYGKKQYPHLKLKTADGHKIPYKAKSFDVVICAEVLEHVLDPLAVTREIKRVLKDDGIAVIEMDTGNWLFSIVWYFWTHARRGVWKDAHIQVFNTKRLQHVIRKAGLHITQKKIFNHSMAVAFKAHK